VIAVFARGGNTGLAIIPTPPTKPTKPPAVTYTPAPTYTLQPTYTPLPPPTDTPMQDTPVPPPTDTPMQDTPVPPPTGTPAPPPPTSTPSGPTFVSYTNVGNAFTVSAPSNWQAYNTTDTSGDPGLKFLGPQNQEFIAVSAGSRAPNFSLVIFDQGFCNAATGGYGAGRYYSIGGYTWVAATCFTPSGAAVGQTASILYKGYLFYIFEYSPSASLNYNQSTYFDPMENSFTFNF
jgi:hypothetical protein